MIRENERNLIDYLPLIYFLIFLALLILLLSIHLYLNFYGHEAFEYIFPKVPEMRVK